MFSLGCLNRWAGERCRISSFQRHTESRFVQLVFLSVLGNEFIDWGFKEPIGHTCTIKHNACSVIIIVQVSLLTVTILMLCEKRAIKTQTGLNRSQIGNSISWPGSCCINCHSIISSNLGRNILNSFSLDRPQSKNLESQYDSNQSSYQSKLNSINCERLSLCFSASLFACGMQRIFAECIQS